MSTRIILDCDPGHDDTMAILLAAGCPDIDLVAITTVAGNQTLEKVTLNARRVCTVAGLHQTPIYAGCDRPLLRPAITAGHIHGESGLDGPQFGEPTVGVQAEHAVDYLVGTLMACGQDITLVPTGPLTNIAAALIREPAIAARTREVVLMGGAYTRGNVTPAAEFNILADPEAAAIVFSAGWPVTMVGLDLTHQAGAPQRVLDAFRAMGTPVGARPGLITVREAFVTVETKGEWSAGMTVTDFDGRLGHPPNSKVATTLDTSGFWDLMIGAVAALGEGSAQGSRRPCGPGA
jgi:purine nucleosidase